jgi:hypothetical protein
LGARGWEVAEALRSEPILQEILFEEVSPGEALQAIMDAARRCSTGATEIPEGNQCIVPALPGGSYSSAHHRNIDDSTFGSTLVARSDTKDHENRPRVESSHLGGCVAAHLCTEPWFSDPQRIDGRILWLYFLVEEPDSGVGTLFYWPNTRVPEGFNPWRRPWYRECAPERKDTFEGKGGYAVGMTEGFRDAFSGQEIKTICGSLEFGKARVVTGIDIRAGASRAVYARMLLLNLVISLSIAVLSALVSSGFNFHYLRAWYRAWLGVSLLYVISATVHFAGGPWGIRNGLSDELSDIAVSLVSITNSAFFLLTALLLFRPHRLKHSRRTTFLWALATITAYFIASVVDAYRTPSIPTRDAVESIFTAIVLLVLGRALVFVVRQCTYGMQSIEKYGVRLDWSNVGSVLLWAFFLTYAGLQLSIALWAVSPALEDLFLYASVPMKVGIAGIFFAVVLLELYWEKFSANNLFVSAIHQGVFVVDKGNRILTVNEHGVSMINLPAGVMRGKHLSQVLFRSLRERIVGKKFVEGHLEPEETCYLLSAALTGRGTTGGASALYLISKNE